MSKLITALPVERTEDGYFCHPAYSDLFRGRDGISQEEYDGWLKENNLEDCLVYLENSDDEATRERFFETGDPDLSSWNPERPEGDGWFIGCIADHEDGPFCVWFRAVESKGAVCNG